MEVADRAGNVTVCDAPQPVISVVRPKAVVIGLSPITPTSEPDPQLGKTNPPELAPLIGKGN
jgi:hypothetical protein